MDDLKEGSEKQATPENSIGSDSLDGCVFPIIVLGLIIFGICMAVSWVRKQESVSESLGKVAAEATKPVKQEIEKFQKGYNEEKK